MGRNKSFNLIIILLFSFILSTIASRSLIVNQNHAESTPRVLLAQKNGRMDLEVNDYPGTGANSNHDPDKPKNPGNSG
ncbi:hypothetical protein SOVF_171990 [Spinacia oleracea]|nr:hypothetical protein SOVF_171990 [Spinacia oleracea]